MNTMLRPSCSFVTVLCAVLIANASTSLKGADTIQAATDASTKLLMPYSFSTTSISSTSGWYASLNGGVAFLPDVSASVLGGTVTAKFDDGYRIDLTLGNTFYQSDILNPPGSWTFGAELEAGWLNNSLSSLSTLGVTVPTSGDLTQIPVLANLVWNYNLSDRWTAYLGLGGGFAHMKLNVNSPLSYSDSETDGVFQGKVGLRYQVNDQSALGIGYKFLDVLNTSFGTDVPSHTLFLEYTLNF